VRRDSSRNGASAASTGCGGRDDAAGLVQSILEPNAQIVEGFGTQLVVTVPIDKVSITQRQSLHSSSMPEYGGLLTPQQVADLVAFLTSLK
jgi:sugar (pentulose or hexulose) kinase